MPIQVTIDNKDQWISPNSEWKTELLDSKNSSFIVDPDFYVEVKEL